MHKLNSTFSLLTLSIIASLNCTLNVFANNNKISILTPTFAIETLTRGPYLQKLAPTSITIKWSTSEATQSQVKYGTDSLALTAIVTNTVNVTEHTITLVGLTPATKYFYSIGSPTLTLQGDGQNYFITSPTVGSEGKYNFWMLGDCGNNSITQTQVRDQFLSYMGNTPTNAWMILGDNAYSSGSDLEYQSEFFNIYQNNILKHTPLYPVPGNHDYNGGTVFNHTVPYYSIFDTPTNAESGGIPSGTEAYYSYDYGNVHFISLDSYGKEDNVNRLYDTLGPEAVWLKQDLNANTNNKFIVAYWHHPPYTMGSHNSDTESELTLMHTNFITILERYNVDLIVCGHSHVYERSRLMKGHFGNESTFNAVLHNVSQSTGNYNGTANSCTYVKDALHGYTGTIYVVSGSGGQLSTVVQSSWPHDAMTAANNHSIGGSVVLTVESNRMDVRWVCADGIIRDNFTLIKDANKRNQQTINLGQSVTLQASWPGQYYWPFNGATTRSVTVTPTVTTRYAVQDQYQCVLDSFTVNVIPPSILTNINLLSICPGSNIQVGFTVNGTLQLGNVFTAQLSNASGSFSNPINIGTLSSIGSGTISATIPLNTPIGAGYRIRVTGSSPSIIGSDNGSNIGVNLLPAINITTNTSTICSGSNTIFNATTGNAGNSPTYQWKIDGINVGNNSPTFTTSNIANTNVVTCLLLSNSFCVTTNTISSNSIAMSVSNCPIAPSANFISSNQGCINVPINFTDMSSNAPSNWLWTFQGGTPATSSLQNPSVTYTQSGIFYVSLTASNSGGNNTKSITGYITIYPAKPTTPGTISGKTIGLCPFGISTTTYSVAPVANSTFYTWLTPNGISILNGQGSNIITVAIGSTFSSGNISVTSGNSCGNSLARTLAIRSTPPAPVTVTGTTVGLCPLGINSQSYTVTAVSGAMSYSWTAPLGSSIVAGQGTSIVTLGFGTTFTTGSLTVTANNICGNSAAKSIVLLSKNLTPASLAGIVNGLCPSGVAVTSYTVANSAGATYYNWSIPNGSSIIAGQGTTSLNVSFGSTFTTGTISVTANNSCGNSSAKSLALRSTLLAPASLGGISIGLCPNGIASSTYTTSPVVGATSYFWSVPIGTTIISGIGSTAVTLEFGSSFTSGAISVSATNSCGISPAKTLMLTSKPGTPSAIGGQSTGLCVSSPKTYTVAALAGTNFYQWSLPPGTSLISGQGTNTIVLNFLNTFTSGNLSVIASNACGSSVARILTLKSAPGIASSLSGPSSICGLTSAIYNCTSVVGSSYYLWSVPVGMSIVSGQGTTSVNIAISTAIAGSIKVIASNNCGVGAAKSLVLSGCASPLWFNNEIDSKKLSIYPNPSKGKYTIISPLEEGLITIYNVLGEVVKQFRISSLEIDLDISDERNGIYFIIFTNNNNEIIDSKTLLKE